MTRNIQIARPPRLVGNDKHLKLQFIAGTGKTVDAIGFNMGPRIAEVIDAKTIDIAYFPTINRWQGRSSLDLHLKDFRESSNGV